MSDKELIKQEIERIEQILDDFNKTHNNTIDNGIVSAKKNICKHIKSFIDSLPEEPKCIYNRTLEERKHFCKYCSAFCTVRIEEEPASEDLKKEISKWRNHYISVLDNNLRIDLRDIEVTANYFAEWKKQQMMKEAVELRIVESFNPVGTENEKPHGFTALCYNAKYPDFYPVTGQTIKVIPIK